VNTAGGITAKIVRPGYGPRKTVADRALLNYTGWHYVLGDRGSMDALRDAAIPFANWIMGDGPRPVQTDEQRDAALAVECIEP